MKKKTVLIAISIILLMSTLAWAFWPGIAIRAGVRLATSQGAKRVVVQAGLSQGAAKQAARLALVQNKPDLAWKISSTAAALVGINYLTSDISGLTEEMLEDNPSIYQETSKIHIMANGVQFKIEGPVIDYETGSTWTNIKVWNEWEVWWDSVSQTWKGRAVDEQRVSSRPPGQWGRITVSVRQTNGTWIAQSPNVVAADYTYDVTPIGTTITDVVTEGIYDHPAIDEWVEENPEAWIHPDLVTNTLTNTAPSNAQDMGVATDVAIMDEVLPDPNTGEKKDAVTMLDQRSVENPTDATDTYNAPTQPAVPIFDTAMDMPEKMSIPDKITDFLNNAPFMNVINNFSVSASSGSSTLTFTVWGHNYTWDFSRYENIYNMMAAVLIALAYIWSAQIVFGGRA